jgi:hypothetical protein
MLNMSTGNRVHDKKKRGNDAYNTPPPAVRSLLAQYPDGFIPKKLWEPACGAGNIVRTLEDCGHEVVATDLTRRARGFEHKGGVDFLAQQAAPAGVGGIFTNPPFKVAEQFVALSIDLVPVSCFLLRVQFLEGLRWCETRGFSKHLRDVVVFAPRLPMMHRKNWKGKKNENSAIAFAWFVFERNCNMTRPGARPGVMWVNWRDHATAEEIEFYSRRRRSAGKTHDRNDVSAPEADHRRQHAQGLIVTG